MLEPALVNRLEGSTSVTSICGTRIYPIHLPQEPKLPAVTYEVISAVRESGSGIDTGTVHARVQTTSWGSTPTQAANLKEGVRDATQRWSGTSTGVVVHTIFLENEFVFFDDETGHYAHTLDLMVHYEE